MIKNKFKLSIENVSLQTLDNQSASTIASFVCPQRLDCTWTVPHTIQTLYSTTLGRFAPPAIETWFSTTPCTYVSEPNVKYAFNGDILMGVIELSETPHSLREISQTAYERLFEIITQNDYPYVWRIWNYLPDINGNTDAPLDSERYKQFNFGRQDGFKAAKRSATVQSPAACALGIPKEYVAPLSVSFLASKTPMLALENPLQISAFHYPEQYGQQRPTFSRAGLCRLPHQELFLLSGTASIIGHETVHVGNVKLQTEETLRNIRIMLEQANLNSATMRAYTFENLTVRVYIRHKNDYPVIAEILASHTPFKHIDFIHADICREDLDVEIEGWALENCA